MHKYQKNGNKTTLANEETKVKPLEYLRGGTQLCIPFKEIKSQRGGENLMKAICNRENLIKAWKHVVRNKGSAGKDGMIVQDLKFHIQKHWETIKEQLLNGTYQFQPIKEVLIPKAGGKGKRKLGIPTVMDRFISQAILQVMQRYFDPQFSNNSYGFRPKKSAHQAIRKAQEYVQDGYEYVVDIDLENFFDNINHDKLMSEIAKVIKDKILLKLLRRFLQVGLLKRENLSQPQKGTPQGNPLSPLLSNILLDQLDKELERRGHKFVRYADDCNIYVRSKRAAQRVRTSISSYIHKKLKLKVNKDKSKVGIATGSQFLGFELYYYSKGGVKIGLSNNSMKAFKDKIRALTRASKWSKVQSVVKEIRIFCKGWLAYFSICQGQSKFTDLEGWIRRRLRGSFWRQWKKPSKRMKELLKTGFQYLEARKLSASSKGPWRISMCKGLHKALPNKLFSKMGLPRLQCQPC